MNQNVQANYDVVLQGINSTESAVQLVKLATDLTQLEEAVPGMTEAELPPNAFRATAGKTTLSTVFKITPLYSSKRHYFIFPHPLLKVSRAVINLKLKIVE